MSMEAGARMEDIGTVYGVLLNDRATVERLRATFTEAPYKAPPRAPILYIKSRNTFACEGAVVVIPAPFDAVRIDGTVGAVIGSRATRVSAAAALDHVGGYLIVSDVTLPHESYYRPAIRQRNRDGFCPMSRPCDGVRFDVAAAEVSIFVNDALVHRRTLGNLVRALPALLEDITAFMTLEAGDVVLLGPPDGAPVAKAGDRIRIEVPKLGALSHALVAEEPAS